MIVVVGMLTLMMTWTPVVAADGIEVRSDLVYRVVDGQELALDVYLPSGGGSHRGAVLVIHGGGWWSGDKADANRKFMSQQLAQQGFVAVAVNYRLVPKDVYPAAIEDLEAAVAWLRQPAQVSAFGIDPNRIGALGASSGAHLAGLLGSIGKGPLTQGSRVAAVVSFSGPMSCTGDLASA
ncbi:MAG: alpha/beta hydrolase fold domain-containing protein, partial [Thermomicrobiales bacterium]